MSDQETAIQLIRNEAAELIVRARAAGLRIMVASGPAETIVKVEPLPPTPTFHFCTSDRNALKPELGDRRFWAILAGEPK